MKVFYVNTVHRPDSAPAAIMRHIAARVEADGGTAEVFSRRGPGVLWHFAMGRAFDTEGRHSSLRTRTLIRRIRAFSPDIIHLHNLHGHFIDYELLFRFLAVYGRPVVWTLHDCWAFTGHCAYYTMTGCDLWMTGCQRCPGLSTYPLAYSDRSADNYERKRRSFTSVPDIHLTVPSAWMSRQVERSFLSHLPLTVISNGVDTDIFTPAPKSDDGVLKMIAVAQRWTPRKGRFDLNRIRALLNPDERIDFISGVKDRNEMAGIYSRADILLTASRQESFGMTPIEAMACGTPAIVNSATALPELVTESTGRVIDFSNPAAAVKAIRDFRAELGTAMSERCRSHVLEKYSARCMADRYMALYRSLV